MAVEDVLIEMLASPYFGARARAALRASLDEWVDEEEGAGGGGGAGGGLFEIIEVTASNTAPHIPAFTGNAMMIIDNPDAIATQIVWVQAGPVGSTLHIVRSAENADGIIAVGLEDAQGSQLGVLPEVQASLTGNHDSITLVYTGPTRGYVRVSKRTD